MTRLEARAYAGQFAECWPDRLQAQVDQFAERTDGHGYLVRLIIPRENRILRLSREQQFQGMMEICTVLLGEPTKRPSTTQKTCTAMVQ